MALANSLWGVPRIHAQLLKLGLDVSQRTHFRMDGATSCRSFPR
jgi:hypothetical protein